MIKHFYFGPKSDILTTKLQIFLKFMYILSGKENFPYFNHSEIMISLIL